MVLFALTSSSSSKLKQRSHQSFSESLMEDSIEDAEAIIHRWISPQLLDSSSSSSSFCCISSLFSTGNREEARRFIGAVSTLHSGMVRLISINPALLKLVRAENLMRVSMDHLAKEFYRILKSNRRFLDPESVSVRSRISTKRVSDEDADAMADLKMIADCMTSSGYGRECFGIYRKIRKSIIVEALDQLGFEDLSLSQMQKLDWECLEKKMRKWLRAARKAVTTLFYGERILSDHVFSSSSAAIRESSFAEITLQSALAMLSFPGSMAKSRKSPEKIFLTLDVYQSIVELLPKIEEVFSHDWLEKHEWKVKKYVAKFEEIVWGEMMMMMTSLPTAEEEEGEAEEVIRRFSDRFEEAYKRQTGWVVPDPKLRDEIKVSVAMMLIPAYSEFYKKYRVGLRKNVGFAPEDIGNYLSDLYFGTGGSGIVSSIHSSDTDI